MKNTELNSISDEQINQGDSEVDKVKKQIFKKFWIISNYTCDNRCKFCYTEAMNFWWVNMSFNNEKKIIDTMTEFWAEQCILIWWEPTLHENIVDVIEYWKWKDLFMKIITNWRKYSKIDFLKELKEVGLWFTAVSIHWTTQEEHYRNTKSKKSFWETLQWIKNCIEIEIPFITLSTINLNNIDNIVPIARFLKSIGVSNIVFNLVSPVEWTPQNENVLKPEVLSVAIEEAYKTLKKEKIKVVFYSSIPMCLFNNNIINEMIDEWYLMPLNGENMSDCNIYDWSGVAVDPKWNVLLCTHAVKSPVAEIFDKNLLYKDKEDVNKILLWVKWMIWKENWKYPSEICIDCSMKDKCIWWCPLYWRTFETKKLIRNVFK